MPTVTPFLWFDNQSLEAAEFYVSIFPNSKVSSAYEPDEKVVVVSFELDGQKVLALNGGPHFKLTEAFSFSVDCKDQAEVNYYWSKLSEGGEEVQCGWLKDKFGLSWQIVPRRFVELMGDPDPAKVKRVFDAMMTMVKLDIAMLEKAAEGTA